MGRSIIRNILLVVLVISAIFMVIIKQYIAGIVIVLILFSEIFRERVKNKKITITTPISEEVAEAMASKIIFEAQQHRKVRDDVDHLNIGSSEEE
mgnify:CR=1 FL=1